MTMLTDEKIRKIFLANGFTVQPGLTDLKAYVYEAAHAIESAACADRDARIAELEQRNTDLHEDVQRFKEHALSEKDARMALERELEEVRKDAELYQFIESACEVFLDGEQVGSKEELLAAMKGQK